MMDSEKIKLNQPWKGLYIPPMIWASEVNFDQDLFSWFLLPMITMNLTISVNTVNLFQLLIQIIDLTRFKKNITDLIYSFFPFRNASINTRVTIISIMGICVTENRASNRPKYPAKQLRANTNESAK